MKTLDPALGVCPRPYRLHNTIQPYDWGTRDGDAFIPRLLGIEPQPGRPYAELWLGAHPKAPSKVVLDGESIPLDLWITAHPQELLGERAVRRFGPRLQFLLKVLSSGEPLSIQAHPNKAQAEVLHARHPEHYPDDNHKPEIAIALDALDALVGVKPIPALLSALTRYPELAGFIGPEAQRFQDSGSVKPVERAYALFTALLRRSETDPVELEQALDRLAYRLDAAPGCLEQPEALFLELRQKYLGPDVGLFALFLLNLVHLQVGQAIFTPAGVPHAYLRGNIIECMANSDNVVRVGLTQKFKDAEALVEILDARPSPAQIMDAGTGLGCVRYPAPSDEFAVTRLRLAPGAGQHWENAGRLSILLVTQGQVTLSWDENGQPGQMACPTGQSILLPAILDGVQLQAGEPAVIFLAEIPVSPSDSML